MHLSMYGLLFSKVFLALKDEDLTELSDYNILLANVGVPVYREGLNDLFHVVSVSMHSIKTNLHLHWIKTSV
jgi:hypothetical protein